MECRETHLMLSAYIDGELSVEDERLVVEHLALCPDCAMEARGLRAVTGALLSVSELDPPTKMLQTIEALTIDRKRPAYRIHIPSLAIPRYAGWAAAAIAIFGIVIGSTVNHGPRQPVQPQTAGNIKPHLRTEIHPVVAVVPAGGISVKTTPKATVVPTEKPIRVIRTRERHRYGLPEGTLSDGRLAPQLAARPKADVKQAESSSYEISVGESLPMDVTPAAPSSNSAVRAVRIASGLSPANSNPENAALEELRSSISAKSRQKKAGSHSRGTDDSYDVGVASIKF